jgi:TolB protein
MLVFERGGELYRMTVDGAETVQLTSTRAKEADPAASSDGITVAYTRGADEVWVTNSQGIGQQRVVASRPRSVRFATTSDPAWSTDGRALFIARSARGENEICGWIYRVRVDGKGLRRVTQGSELHGSPAPSPDGKRLALIASGCEPGGDCCSVRVVNLAGRTTNDLKQLPARFGYEAVSWSPDGRQVVLEVRIDEARSALFLANRNGSFFRRLTRTALNASEPAWSPDGRLIAFSARTRSSGYDLYIIRTDGTGLQRVTKTTADERSPSWLLRS